jgi:hypothetical protein
MRFLVVHRDHVSAARSLVDDSDADDVEVLVYQGEKDPSIEFYRRLGLASGSELVLIGVREKFRKAIYREEFNHGCSTRYYFTTIAAGGRELREWLSPTEAQSEQAVTPREAFANASYKQPHLILANGALDRANDLTSLRHKFANRAAAALSDYATKAGTQIGDLNAFFQNHPFNVQYAVNGEIYVDYTVTAGGLLVVRKRTEQHLKKGDKTKRTNAARVYFETIEYKGNALVLVLYCGPHPKDSFEATVDLSSL